MIYLILFTYAALFLAASVAGDKPLASLGDWTNNG